MNLKLSNLKLIIGVIYLTIITATVFFLLTNFNIQDLMSYEFIKVNKDIILKYRSDHFLTLTIIFFISSIIWILLLGFAMPLLIFAGFVFGAWWGIVIVLLSSTIGATLLYLLAGLFFKDIIEEKFASKFAKLKVFFSKNDITYFMFFRFIGGGGTPYAIQNVLPVLFNMPVKNYIIATLIGSTPSMFVTVSFGSGIESVIDKNTELNFLTVINSPEIYIPIIAFGAILVTAFFVKRIFFK